MRGVQLVALGLSLAMLGGCGGGSDFSDLQSFMDEVRAKPKGTIEPLPAFIPYEAFTYSAAALRHPFQPPVKLDLAQRQKVPKISSLMSRASSSSSKGSISKISPWSARFPTARGVMR